jgi:IS30 family transposase
MSYTHLTSRERYALEQLLLYGCGYREIGRRLGRHHSTIAREVERNGPDGHGGVYVGARGDRLARQRRCLARHQRRWGDARLRATVEAGLAKDWSPQQIAGRLRRDHPRSADMRISAETIYRWVYRAAACGGTLHAHLRRGHKTRRKQGRGGAGRGLIPGRVSIRERPAVVESRRRFGDWEGDLVEGGKGGGVIATLVERKSRYLLARGLASKHAEPAAAALAALLAALPQAWRRTLTLDNGKEFARFKAIEEATGISVYFADPYAAWQRGANENSNGLLRQYLPKGIDMRKISDATLADAIDRINNRPRKCLGYKTPSDILQDKIPGALGC